VAAFVLDASVALAWMLPDEANAAEARRLIDAVVEDGAVVPAHWRLEVGNGLLMAERRGRVRVGTANALLGRLAALPIALDPETAARTWDAAPPLVRRHGLSLYDAAYLELAVRKGFALATFDAALRRAAEAERVPLAAG